MDEIGPWEEHVSFKNTKAIEKYDLSNEKKHDRMKNLKKWNHQWMMFVYK